MPTINVKEVAFLVVVKRPPGMVLSQVTRELQNSIGFGVARIKYLYSIIEVKEGGTDVITEDENGSSS